MPAPATEEPVYRKWMPAASALPDLEHTESIEDASWVYATPGNLGKDQLGAEFRIALEVAQIGLSYFGTDLRDHDHVIGLGSLGTVVESTIDRAHATSTLTSSGFEAAGTYQRYKLFDRTDQPRLVAVADDAVVQARGDARRQKAETVIDAGDGRVPRHHETVDSFARFSDWVGAYPSVLEGFGSSLVDAEPEHAVMAYTFDEQAGYYINKTQYRAGETPSRAELRDELGDTLPAARRAWSVDIEIDDTQVAVQMRVEKERFADDFTEDRLPFVTWGVDREGDTITVRHEAGDPVDVDRLEIEPDGSLQTSLDGVDSLGPGDSLPFDATALSPSDEDRDSIRLTYRLSEDSSARLFGYEPDRTT